MPQSTTAISIKHYVSAELNNVNGKTTVFEQCQFCGISYQQWHVTMPRPGLKLMFSVSKYVDF